MVVKREGWSQQKTTPNHLLDHTHTLPHTPPHLFAGPSVWIIQYPRWPRMLHWGQGPSAHSCSRHAPRSHPHQIRRRHLTHHTSCCMPSGARHLGGFVRLISAAPAPCPLYKARTPPSRTTFLIALCAVRRCRLPTAFSWVMANTAAGVSVRAHHL